MAEVYKTILNSHIDEITIERSRFIGYASPVNSEEAALEFIKNIKLKHRDANHNVYGYVIGFNNEIQRYSDDGEPSGTAGIPVLEVIRKEDLRNVVVVVTRYFGGIKLGAGGLVRAYTKGAKIALDAGKIVTKIMYRLIILNVDYTLLGKIQNDIMQNEFIIKEIVYQEDVALHIYVKNSEVESFKGKAIDWTNNRCEIREGQMEYLTELNGKIIFEE
ncbi:YigZ family protein [Alkaliphilus peptidifermentans]|uniref:Uncharacterized protein, YigZ family n=1 Tax=Alkaliphilus peptidifermentans DSM 18978 TaxID=1120976 RepID=A0A1G5DSM5_9FIRM|nr:YigZ family protein [Alkaliphilus peptidifermentans]SCY17401.1 uncharacterized protein, YigZ family [Alkaliphilus peptidifermentans DSM 18978]